MLQPRRGVASATPIERLSERVNIFLNTKRMHIPWGPMCVSYPDTSAHARTHAHINAQMWGPPYMRNELPEVFFSSVHRETRRRRKRRRGPVKLPPPSGVVGLTTIAYRNVIFIWMTIINDSPKVSSRCDSLSAVKNSIRYCSFAISRRL